MASPPAGFALWRGRFSRIFPPISPHGKNIVFVVWVVFGVLFIFVDPFYALLAVVFPVWCTYFFRDPLRATPKVEGGLIAPADGKVVVMQKAFLPKKHPFSALLPDEKMYHIAIFMDIFDCHVNRVPLSGKLLKTAYKRGKKKAADSPSIDDNEQQSFYLQNEEGLSYVVIQIAGLLARRIVVDVSSPCDVKVGEKFGMILFGSRVDVYFPVCYRPLVNCNQRTIAGETVLALCPERFSSNPIGS